MTNKRAAVTLLFITLCIRATENYSLNNLNNGRKSYFICSKNLPEKKHFTITTGRLEKLSGLEEDVYKLSLIFYKLDNNRFTIISEMIGFTNSSVEEKGINYKLTPFNFKTMKELLEEAFGAHNSDDTSQKKGAKADEVVKKGDPRNFIFEISIDKNKTFIKNLVTNSEPGVEYNENCTIFETPESFIESIDIITKNVDVTVLVSLMQINWHILEVINIVLKTKKHLMIGEKIDFVKNDKNALEAKNEKPNNLKDFNGMESNNKKTFDKVVRELKRLKYKHFRNRLLVSVTICLVISSVICIRVYNLKKEFDKVNK